MSFVIVVSTSSVLYAPPTGSENAFAGQTISSATWNATFTDLSNNGLAVVGTAQANTIKGNTTSSVGVVADMSPAQAQVLLKVGGIAVTARTINFNPSVATDVAVSIPLPAARYRMASLFITNASGSLAAASVGLYTAIGGGGVVVVGSFTLTVTSSLTDTVNNIQSVNSSIVNTVALSDNTLQFRVITPVGSAATADVILFIEPL